MRIAIDSVRMLNNARRVFAFDPDQHVVGHVRGPKNRRHGSGTYYTFTPNGSKEEWPFDTVSEMKTRLPALLAEQS